ncbi:undecaprenyl diphosphate synthase family protein [Anaerocolumna aminovalerica]|uniref:Undecaprenyl diphosphate synthase n=1 Tax=Anaerocolumna aminovalerica TaxID=1527 RepID=A0A1I5JB00_9FIRM|nr:undecaprenyl diphosphate synthase family protein [Anaerocolumna aminovalerica]MBU5334718.1 undecaprenyl diphosphate synthase family protein [Anaerocolumna aminovalerica]MDU6266424.1 undecaprenyl diphosphate synthase family protein [Anaerocolumna aminovalerica]SFO69561.1 undecaprenyl diphosphate synthase [Anaerocolumna aminovalerica]
MRIPNHIGIIPDGNRRWALNKGFKKEEGYDYGLDPGLEVLRLAKKAGIKEITYYGFTTDNCKRPMVQQDAFKKACVDAVRIISSEGSSLLVVGNTQSQSFPKELLPYTKRTDMNGGGIKVNFLVNYGWEWDIEHILDSSGKNYSLQNKLHSSDISRIDLIIRWGNMRRLSGFLPIQSVYSDFYVVEEMWPDFQPKHFERALEWYDKQDVTLGG